MDRVELDDATLTAAIGIVDDFRSDHRRPLTQVAAALRHYLQPHSEQIIVAQRLKRLRTIVDKLRRHPSMSLARMQDIGGCRAVLCLTGGR